ncbi:MAG: hypothetical protein DMF77_05375 [Acidobacteria bacterium]|nr:MAG: hypothetical protein DMF77_05375 [Acidobacteriota bacterium]
MREVQASERDQRRGLRHDDRVAGERRDGGERAEGITEVAQDHAEQHDVEVAQRLRQGVDISIEDAVARREQAVGEPVGVPAGGHQLAIARADGLDRITRVGERHDLPPIRGVEVEGDDVGPTLLHLEAQVSAGRTHVQDPPAPKVEAAQVILDRGPKVPLPAHGAEARQVHDMVEGAE